MTRSNLAPRSRRGVPAALALGALLALGLTACGDDAGSGSAGTDPAAGPGARSSDPLLCPETLTTHTGGTPQEPATSRASVDVPVEALLCTYQAGTGESPWKLTGAGEQLDAARRESLFSTLSWEPQAQDMPCTMDMGPVLLLTWREADGTVSSLATEDFGCSSSWVLPAPDQPSTHAPVQVSGATLEQLSVRHG